MKVTITINYTSRNSLDENLVESEIKETIEGLMMSLRNKVMNITHSVKFGEDIIANEPTPVIETVVKEKVIEDELVKKAPTKSPNNKQKEEK